MADISQVNIENNIYDIKDTTARNGLTTKQDTLTPGQNISISKDTTTGVTTISASTSGAQIDDTTASSSTTYSSTKINQIIDSAITQVINASY